MTEIFVNAPSEIITRLRVLAETYPMETEKALERWLKLVQRRAMILCPVDTGRLRGSAYSAAASIGGATVGVIGFRTNYAIYVHENLLAHHEPPTQAKFLEVPLIQGITDFAEELIKILLTILQSSAGRNKQSIAATGEVQKWTG